MTESVAAYKVCKERIYALEKAFQAALTDVGGEVGRTGAGTVGNEDEDRSASVARRAAVRHTSTPAGSGFTDMDDDVPFKEV